MGGVCDCYGFLFSNYLIFLGMLYLNKIRPFMEIDFHLLK